MRETDMQVSPVFDWAVRNLNFGGGEWSFASAVALANFRDDPVELLAAFEAPQSVFQVFGNPEPRAVPGRKLTEVDTAPLFSVLVHHQVKVPGEKLDLLVGCGLPGRRVTLGGAFDFVENPGIEHCSTADGDGGAPCF